MFCSKELNELSIQVTFHTTVRTMYLYVHSVAAFFSGSKSNFYNNYNIICDDWSNQFRL